MFHQPDTRWGAFGLHLIFSIGIFIVLALVIVYIWYPGFTFATDGGWHGIRLIAGVDLVLGPLLTLIVYKKFKKNLRIDLIFIGIVQVIALSIGSYLVYQERPLAIIFADGKFNTMSKTSLNFHGKSVNDIPLLKDAAKPVWIYTEPVALLENESPLQYALRVGATHMRIENHRPFKENFEKIIEHGVKKIEGKPDSSDNQRYFKLQARYKEGYLLFDLKNKSVIDFAIKSF